MSSCENTHTGIPLGLDEKYYIKVYCPSCDGLVWVPESELNCAIFRHAVYLATGQPINPHASKEECDELVRTGAVLGCAQPFRIESYKKAFIPGTLPLPTVNETSADVAYPPMVTGYRAVHCGFV